MQHENSFKGQDKTKNDFNGRVIDLQLITTIYYF